MCRKSCLLLVVVTILSVNSFSFASTTERVSVDSNGYEGNNYSYIPFISADGNYVVFRSSASNLVASDTNGFPDIFIRDRQTGSTEIVSVDISGNSGNSGSYGGSVCSGGRYVAFVSSASNLVSGDTNGVSDIFVRDRQTGVTERVSVDSNGNESNGSSNNSGGCGNSPNISADGRYVAFFSSATNLVPNDTNAAGDVFVRDRQTGSTEIASVDSAGTRANAGSGYPSISANGRYVVFPSAASNLVANDTNGVQDIFIHDRQTGSTIIVSVNSSGSLANGENFDPTISSDGRYVAFDSLASNLVSGDTNGVTDAFVHDRQTGITERISMDSAGVQGNGHSRCSRISDSGGYVAFQSVASNLVPIDTNGVADIFTHDRQTGVTERVSVDSAGNQAWGNAPTISGDGRYVAFESDATNLVMGDTNNVDDAFVHDRDSDGDGYSIPGGDCNDSNSAIYPGATEIKNDKIDQNCNGRDNN